MKISDIVCVCSDTGIGYNWCSLLPEPCSGRVLEPWAREKYAKGQFTERNVYHHTWKKWLQVRFTDYCINPFVPNAPFLYPLKKLENRKVFWCFQGLHIHYHFNHPFPHEYYNLINIPGVLINKKSILICAIIQTKFSKD